MKGKGKGKDTSENKECPLQFPDLTPLDPAVECPVYCSIIQRGKEEGIGLKEIDALQFELETLLVSVAKRRDDLEEEMQILTAWQEKKDKKPPSGKAEADVGGKRNRLTDIKPTKKHKDNDGKAHLSPSVGRPKTKNAQTIKVHEHESVESPSESSKPQKTDAPNRFWASLEPYFAEITQDHIKFLKDWIKSHDDDTEYFKIPPLGNHYSIEWSNKEILEEQKEGIKANEKRRGLNNNNSSLNTPDAEKIMKAAEKECITEERTPLGPLAQRLVSCLIEEKIMPALEDTIDTSKEIPEINNHAKMNSLKSINVVNASELEKRIRKELEDAGILEPEDIIDGENAEDLVLAELKDVQAALKIVVEQNLAQKNKLLKLATEEIARQDVRKKLQLIDSEIMDFYRKKLKRKTSSSKKERDQVLRILKDREELVKQLESMGNVFL